MSDKKKMIYEINGNDLMEKGFNAFIADIEKSHNETPELANYPMPQAFKDMLKETYQMGFEDGCLAIAEQVKEALGGHGTVTVNKN